MTEHPLRIKPKLLPENPIFVVGYPRSGTTLVQSLITALAVDPRVFSFPETHYFNVLEKALLHSRSGRIHRETIDGRLDLIREKTGLPLERRDLRELRRRAGRSGMDSREMFEWIVRRNLQARMDKGDWGRAFRWMEKTPYHANFLDRILALYPQAQVLHVVRHPVPAVISRKRNFPFNRDTPLEELARHWLNLTGNAARAAQGHPGRIRTLRYEDLVAGLLEQVREVGDFLAVTMDPGRLDRLPAALAGVSLPAERWKTGAGKEVVVDANRSYRDRVSPEDVACIETAAAAGMRSLGYGGFLVDEIAAGGPIETL